MVEVAIEIPEDLEKIEVRQVDLQRRNSTGSSDIRISEEKAIPHYLRASTGSCHDICKYGTRRNLHKTASWPIPTLKRDKYTNISFQKEKTKMKPLWTNALNHPPKSSTKSNIKDTKTSKKTKKKSILPHTSRTNTSIPKRDSLVEVKNRIEKSGSHENVPARIIHCIGSSSSSNQNDEMDSTVEENRSRVLRSGNISPEESDSNSRKLKFRTRKVLDIDGGENGELRKKSLLRRQASEGDLIRNYDYDNDSTRVVLRQQDVEPRNSAPELLNNMIEETVSKLVQGRKSKVKALVGAFESLINLQVSSTRFRTL